MTNITLYHGGHRDDVYTMQSYGLSTKRYFYCTRNRSLAEAAREIHGIDGIILSFSLPKIIFDSSIRIELWDERPYLGCIQIEGTREVIIHRGLGINILNFCIRHLQPELSKNYNLVQALHTAYPTLKSMNF